MKGKEKARQNLSHFMASAAYITLSMSMAAEARAQDQASNNADTPASGLEDIVVTAQKRTERLQDVPIAVSAIGSGVLETSGVDTQVSLPRLTPGLTLNSGAGFTSPYLRGIGTPYATLGLESSVATYLDDQYLSRPVGGFFSFADVERVEVLKGPQGTLYGRNAAAGAIRIITKDPTDIFEGSASASYGRFEKFGVDGMVNVPLGSEVAIRLAGSYDRRHSFIRSINPDYGPGDKKEVILRGKLRANLGERLSVKLTADYANTTNPEQVAFVLIDKTAPQSIGLARGGTASPGFYTSTQNYGPNSGNPQNRTKSYGVQGRADLDLDFATLSSISSYRRSDADETCENDATDIPYQHCIFLEKSDAYAQELQLVSNGGSPVSYVAGAYYYYEKGNNEYALYGQVVNDLFGLPYSPTIGEPNSTSDPIYRLIGRAKTESFAPYVQASYKFARQLELTLGARYTWETKTLIQNYNIIQNLGPDIVLLNELDTKYKFQQFTPKATLSYRPIDDVLVYLTYSRGFKSGGFSLPSSLNSQKIKPEILDSYEFGWKSEFGSIRFNGSLFYYDFKNLQVQRSDNETGGQRVENAANARLYGGEIDVTAALTRDLQLGFGASYLHSEYRNYLGTASTPAASTAACQAAGGPSGPPYPAACLGYVVLPANLSGNPLINAPKWSGYGRLQYDRDLPGDAGRISFSTLLNYTDKYYYVPEQLLKEPSKWLWSASLTWHSSSDRFSIGLFGDNLLGEKYDIYKTAATPAAYRSPGAPRTWGVTIGTKL